MPSSPYVLALRDKIGHELLMLQSVSVMLFDEGRLMLAQHRDTGLWVTIGGAIEPDESPADAAVRECWEETGLLVEPTEVLGVFGGPEFRIPYPNGDVASYTVTVFEVRRIEGKPRPDGVEVAALRFISRDEAAALPMSVGTRAIVTRAFERTLKPFFARPTWQPPSERR
ncbi:MAG TPA: NUDIX domain-containing protein [Candidatus Acidoferrum sp.]|nr:NUDIX domain-containing protein [Candidatus Acidoferrum sp.]